MMLYDKRIVCEFLLKWRAVRHGLGRNIAKPQSPRESSGLKRLPRRSVSACGASPKLAREGEPHPRRDDFPPSPPLPPSVFMTNRWIAPS